MKWIRVGFEATLKTHLEDEFRSSMRENKVGCGADKVFKYSGQALGVRDKITWNQPTRTWSLNVEEPKHEVEQYCHDNNLTLKVPLAADEYEDFDTLRHKALLDACTAWNELDGSRRHRIKLPDAGVSGPKLKVAQCDESAESTEE